VKLSEDRVNHLSHLILDQLVDQGFVFMAEDREPSVRSRIKRVFVEELKKEDDLDDKIRQKIASYKRAIPEGSSEWQLLYQRFYREEKARKGSS
jgi:hypothetical protein